MTQIPDDLDLTEVLVYQLPDCDVHEIYYREPPVPAVYDGETDFDGNPWAFMCEHCFQRHGTGLGLGRGQRLILRHDDEEDEAAELGRAVGAGMGSAVVDVAAKVYGFARRARWVDGPALVFLLLVLPCVGVWWPGLATWFGVSFLLDVFLCWKLNPKRQAKRKGQPS